MYKWPTLSKITASAASTSAKKTPQFLFTRNFRLGEGKLVVILWRFSLLVMTLILGTRSTIAVARHT